KRLLGKFSRPPSPTADAMEDADAPSSSAPPPPETVPADVRPPPAFPPKRSNEHLPDFELREPTPEEQAATILSRQDFIVLDRMLAGEPMGKPVVRHDGAGRPIKGRIVLRDRPAPPSPSTAPGATIAAMPLSNEKNPGKEMKAALVGFFEGFLVREWIGGWAGDSDDPSCRTIRVAVLLDGKEVASGIADRPRKDIPYGEFHVPYKDPDVWRYILEERLVVRAMRDGGEPVTLRALGGVFKQANALRERAEAAKPAEAAPAAAPIADGGTVPTVVAGASKIGTHDLSSVQIPVGTIARDQSSIVGRDGFLFGYLGSGKPAAQYGIPLEDARVQRNVASWLTLFRSREALLKNLGIACVQTILPEKATIMHDRAPAGLGPITARLQLLEGVLEEQVEIAPPASDYTSLISALRSSSMAGVLPYLRTGSGLRAAGTQLVFYRIVQKMATLLPDHATALAGIADLCGYLNPGKQAGPMSGDLGRTFDVPIYECDEQPDLSRIAGYITAGAPAVDKQPSGLRSIWHNPRAPSSLKVMALGTGCFGKGGGPIDLSWWFKTMFAEYHLVESIDLDENYVRQHRPDAIICMNRERTLPTLPAR
ncbi:MAG: hypothetical protein JWR77_2504, partial [Rhizorhabdus sp.]|nr:hypothetical protein [Rhizorhabdus sp.]